MKAIHADPKEVRKLFTDKYIIPDFQRPYSWELEHCERLWDDLIRFLESDSDSSEKYFLGNMVIHKSKMEDGNVVIDGQQRLTTLLLLIKALHQKAGTVNALAECLKMKDPLTSEITNELRVESHVLEDNLESLKNIVLNNGDDLPECNRMKSNYLFFVNSLECWWKDNGYDPKIMEKYILMLLDKVVLLPIHCGSEDDALSIFETINNTGLSLNDTDIFKAKMYHAIDGDKGEFIRRWNELSDHNWLFRSYMHVVRAKENETGKEVGLRTFFTSNKRLVMNWENVLTSLELLDLINGELSLSCETDLFWQILEKFPNYYWKFPLCIFLHKNFKSSIDGGVVPIKDGVLEEYTILIRETVKYFYTKGITHNSVNAVRDTVFKVCALIESGGDYLEEYKSKRVNDMAELSRKLDTDEFGRYLRGLVLLGAALCEKQDRTDLNTIAHSNWHVEHILPKKWNDYDEWTDESWQKNINTLGNLVPLEWRLNISAKNEYFERKQKSYLNSLVWDAKNLVTLPKWTEEECKERNEVIKKRILSFLTS